MSMMMEVAASLAASARKTMEVAEIDSDAIEALPFDEKEGRKVARSIEVESWLPLAASTYLISPRIEDYVIVPVMIIPSDIPNRNNVAFSREQLLAYNPTRGMPAFKTFRGMPTHLEHKNTDFTKAKGIILDTYISPFPEAEGDLVKIMALCAFDGTKDAALHTQITKKIRKYYSMGAFIDVYECSICGSRSKNNEKNTPCGHVKRGTTKFFDLKGGLKKPSYYLANGITGFEISSVTVPAWAGAEHSVIFGSQ